MSQATCKVCQNKILIKKPPEGTPVDELVSAPGIPIPEPRAPMPTPTRISPASGDEMEPTVADPLPPGPPSSAPRANPLANAPLSSSLSAPLPGEGSGLSQLPEQELSNSWREAIMDNRQTIAMLKKQGVAVPPDGSTATGAAIVSPPIGAVPAAPPAVAPSIPLAPPPPAFAVEPTNAAVPILANAPPPPAPEQEKNKDKPLELATGRTAGTITNIQGLPPTRVATPPRPFVKEGSSKLLSFATGGAAALIAVSMLWNGSWGAGLSGWLAFGAACFIAVGGLLNSLLNGPGMGAVIGVGFVAAIVALAGMTGVFLTGGARTRVIAEAHPFLAPIAKYEIHLAKGLPVATPEPAALETPVVTTSPEPSGTP